MSRLSRRLLAGCDLAGIKAARRRNYLTLLDHFRAAHPECLLSPELPGGACPLCFPVRLRRPPALFARSLAGRGVEGWPWWQELFHPAAPWAEFPEALALKKRVLALPVHQGLGPPEMEAVIRAFEAAWRLLS
jgi:dTDP-4-amino-4,6-dideoxygalactose transaminase